MNGLTKKCKFKENKKPGIITDIGVFYLKDIKSIGKWRPSNNEKLRG